MVVKHSIKSNQTHHQGYRGEKGNPSTRCQWETGALITLVPVEGSASHYPSYNGQWDIPSYWLHREVGQSITKVTEWNRASIALATVSQYQWGVHSITMVTVEVGHSVTPVTVGGCASHHPGYCGRLGKPITLVTMAGGALHHPGYRIFHLPGHRVR